MPDALPQQRQHNADLFPSPAEGELVELNPPPFYWLQVPGVAEYRVIVQAFGVQPLGCGGGGGRVVLDERTSKNYLIPRQPLSPGKYRWQLEGDGKERGWQNFTLSEKAITHIVPTAREILARVPAHHPRHMYYREDLDAVIAKYPNELETLKNNLEVALNDGFLQQPRLHRTDGRHASAPRFREVINVMRQFVDRNLVAAALAHLLLKEPRATEFVRTAFLDIIDWNPDLYGPYSAHSPWGDELGLSLNRCLFAVYDWTFELYDDKQHAYIRSTLAQYARQIATTLKERNFFTSPGDSHAGRMPAYLGAAAMVLKGYIPDEEAEAWLQSALDIYGSFFPHYGGRDGAWAEGTFYSTSYTKWYLPFFLALERHMGGTGFSFLDRPFYRNYAQYLIHFCPPSGEEGKGWEIHPFGDGYWCHPEDAEWPGFFAQNPYSIYAERFGPQLARQYAAMQPKPKLFQLHLLDVFRNPHPQTNESPGIRSLGPNAEEPRAEPTRWFRDVGFVSMHANLENPNEDTAVLVRASRYGAVSHQHADQGNFAIISRGKALISPSGYFGHGYGTNHHFNWTNQTQAHNCILVDGAGGGQKSRDFRTTARVESVSNEGWITHCLLDLSNAYPQLRSYHRRILFLRPGLVIVLDDLHSPTEVEFSWLAHTLSPPTQDDNAITVRRDPASMRLQLFSYPNENIQYSFTDRFAVDLNEGVSPEHHRHQPNQYHLTWRAPKVRARRFAAVIALNDTPVTTAWRENKLENTLIVQSADRTLELPLDPESNFTVAMHQH